MKISVSRQVGGDFVAAVALFAAALSTAPISAADSGMVEVHFCVVDLTGQTQANVPVQLQSQGTDGNWYVQRQGDSGAGCTSFYRAPAPATYRVTTAANNTGACQGSTPAVYAVPGPQLNIPNLTMACTIGASAPILGPVTGPADVWLQNTDSDGDGTPDHADRFPYDPYNS